MRKNWKRGKIGGEGWRREGGGKIGGRNVRVGKMRRMEKEERIKERRENDGTTGGENGRKNDGERPE